MALNRCEFIGNLGRDPEIRTTTAGKKTASISIGVSEKWTDSSGEKKERTEWVRCVAFARGQGDGLPGVIERFLHKGSKIYVAGKFTTRKWTDQSGTEKYATEIVLDQMEMLDGAKKDDHAPASGGGNWDQSADDIDDQIPF
jgi:single-strand DNA-binding protein